MSGETRSRWVVHTTAEAESWWLVQADIQGMSMGKLLETLASSGMSVSDMLAPEEKTPMAAAPEAAEELSPNEVREALREGAVAALRMYQEEVQSQYLGALSLYRSDADGLRLAWELRGVARALGVLQGAGTEAGK